MTLHRRLLLGFGYMLLLVVVALAVPLAVNVDRRAADAFYARLDSEAQVIASSLGGQPAPGGSLTQVRAAVATYGGETDARVIVTDSQGTLLADSADAQPARVSYDTPGRPEIRAALAGRNVRLIRGSAELQRDIVVAAYPVRDGNDVVGAVRLSEPVSAVNDRVHESWLAIGVVAGIVLLAALAVAWGIATSLSQPLRSLAATAGRMRSGDLDARAPETGPSDIAEVAGQLNRMADELVTLIEAQREFVGNASNQMRTPLGGLRLRLEALAEGPPENADAAAALDDVDRLSDLVADLLVLSRAGLPPRIEAVTDLAEQARAAADRWRPLADENGQTFRLDEPGEPVPVGADASDVAIVLDNLIENAVAYSPSGASIAVAVSRDGGGTVRVSDDGPGIDPGEAGRVFERFYRGRTGSDSAGGTGLGLAIVHDLTARWGGEVELEAPERGTRVAVRFPAAALEDDVAKS